MDNDARNQLRESTRLLYDELVRREVSVEILDAASSLLEYTTNAGMVHTLFSTCSDKSAATGLVIARDKARTTVIADRIGVSTPRQLTCYSVEEARVFLAAHKRIVIKPVIGSGGRGISTNVTTYKELERAFIYAKRYSDQIIAQQHLDGDDVRLLIIDGTFCAALIRQPAHVTGNGTSTIQELIDTANASPLRNDITRSSLMQIKQPAATHFLGDALEDVALPGEHIRVVGPANVSLGGSMHEATHLVTPPMIADAEAITRRLGLGISGVDMIWNTTTGVHSLIEINAAPGIDIHNDPFSGTSSDCVQRYVEWLIA
jgi:cyanophycin synthetase